MTPGRTQLHVVDMTFAVDEIARTLALTVAEADELFRDPRLTGRLAEVWGTRLFGYQRHTNSNFPGSDGKIVLGPIGRYNISVRAFSRSLKFQQSKFMGSGRTCTSADLISSLEHVEVVVIVDLRTFPTVSFFPIDSKALLKMVRDGLLTPSGMSARRFDVWISETFDVTRVPYAPSDALWEDATANRSAA